MKIGIDASWAIYEKAGVGQYTLNLVRALLADKRHEYVLFFNFFSRRQERLKQIDAITAGAKANFEVHFSYIPVALKERLTYLPFSLKNFYKKEVDVFHAPFFSGAATKAFDKNVVTIHDLTFLKFPEHRGPKLSRYYLERTKLATNRAHKIIAVSEATKKDLVELLKINSSKIAVIAEGLNFNFQNIQNSSTGSVVKKYLRNGQKYILSVGTLEPRKNLGRLVKAYSLLPHNLRRDYKLVLVGQSGWNNGELVKNINNLNLKSSVILPGYIPAEDLPHLYRRASLFVYPSLYEGFGLPLLEAMASGIPVITSDVSSMPEVAGKAAVLINPYKEEEIAGAIKRVLTQPKIDQTLRKRSLIQAHKFRWSKTAAQTIKVYEEVEKLPGSQF